MILVDSNIIFDIVDNDPQWCAWSAGQMRRYAAVDTLAINAIVFAEISPRFLAVSDVDELMELLTLSYVQIPQAAAYRAGKAFAQYRHRGGTKPNVLPDFFIGAHAEALGCPILTRDARRYLTYFPGVTVIAP